MVRGVDSPFLLEELSDHTTDPASGAKDKELGDRGGLFALGLGDGGVSVDGRHDER